MALVTAALRPRPAGALIAAGLFGAALIYGDGIITPAISVLSALEGVNVVTDVLKPYVLPAALVVLVALFCGADARHGQHRTHLRSGHAAVVRGHRRARAAGVLRRPGGAAGDRPAGTRIGFLTAHGWQSFFVLGGVFLALTGGEALYADMGHLGRKPIRLVLVLRRAAGAAAVLRRPDGAAAGQPRAGRQSVLQAGARLGGGAAGGAGDRSPPSSPARRSSPARSR